MKKCLCTIFLIILLIMAMQNCVIAVNSLSEALAKGGNTSKGANSAKAFEFNAFDDGAINDGVDKVAQNTMGTAINVVRTVATAISIIMISYIGMKYMMAAPAERAEFKKSATIYIVGAVLVFAAGNIFTIIANFTDANL